MKSLKESLFDNNIKKDLTIRDVCELNQTNTGRGIVAAGMPIGQMFDVRKIRKYPHPYNIQNNSFYNLLDYFVGIIVDQPMPSETDIKTSNAKWCENLKKALTKYVERDWRSEWDKKVNVYLIEYPHTHDCFAVDIDFDEGTGVYEFLFKQKNL